MKIETDIYDKYAYMFPSEEIRMNPRASCLAWGFECGSGWEKLLANLFAELDAYIKLNPDANIVVDQVKSKFAGLRFYYHGGDDVVSKIIDKYEDASYHTCEECGDENAKEVGQGWIYTLCDPCWEKVKTKRNIQDN